MYPYQYIRYLNLPVIPNNIIDSINRNYDEYKKVTHKETYTWSDSFNKEINEWCQNNICNSMYWGFQFITGDMFLHKDVGTLIKLNCLVDTGGNNVSTEFYEDDQTTLLDSVIIEPHKWHILKADTYHCVKNVEVGQTRFSITGRIF